MNIPFTPLVSSLPASTPFVGPETIERERGRVFKARIGANESAFGISPLAQAAMLSAIEGPDPSWYADPENFELKTLLAAKHGVSTDEICVDGGIDALLGLTVRMLMSPGMSVVTSAGAYPTFNYHVSGFGGQLETVPYQDNHEDPDALLNAAKKHKAVLLYIANPDNPMGTWHSAARLSDMINNLPDQTVLVLDEAYIDFTDKKLAPPIDPANPGVMRFRTFSKAYGMAGMRIGYVIANRDLITGLNKIRNHFAINRLAQLAAAASLDDRDFLEQVRHAVNTGRERIYALADELGLPYLESVTNFVAVDLGTTERAKSVLTELAQHDVFMRMPGVSPLNRYIRIGVGSDTEHAYFADVFTHKLPALSHV